MDNNTAQLIADIAVVFGALIIAGARRYIKKVMPAVGDLIAEQVKAKVAVPGEPPTNGNGNGNGNASALMLALVGSETKRLEQLQNSDRIYVKTKLTESRDQLDGVSIRVARFEREWDLLKAQLTAMRDTQAALQTKFDTINKLAIDLDELKGMVAKLIPPTPPPEPPPARVENVTKLDDEKPDSGEGKAVA